jgi:hypothetical protein
MLTIIVQHPQVVLYMRKRSTQPMDIELVLYGLVAAVDVFSGALVAVLVMVSLYWLALTKLQVRYHDGTVAV